MSKNRVPALSKYSLSCLAFLALCSLYSDRRLIERISSSGLEPYFLSPVLEILAQYTTAALIGLVLWMTYVRKPHTFVRWLPFIVVLTTTFVLSQISHVLYSRPGPYAAPFLFGPPKGVPTPSFPSDQAAVAFAATFFLLHVRRSLFYLAFIASAIASIEPVASLRHWPSDMAFGALLGALIGAFLPIWQERLSNWLGPLGWRAFFDSELLYRKLVALLRMCSLLGVLFILYMPGRAKHSSNIELSRDLVVSAFALYTIISSLLILGVRTHLTRILFPLSRPLMKLRNRREKLTVTIVLDYIFYFGLYVVSLDPLSHIYVLFLLPLITASLFQEFDLVVRSSIFSILMFIGAVFSIAIIVRYFHIPAPYVAPYKQWFVINVILPRLFVLGVCSIAVAWLTERSTQLDRARARYESLLEHIPQMVTRKALDGTITYANKAFCNLNGCSLEFLINKNDELLYGPTVAAQYRKDDERVRLTKTLLPINEQHKPYNSNKTLLVEGHKIPVKDKDGSVIEIQIIFWDVTERKIREMQFLALMANTPDFVYFKDEASKFMMINASLAKRLLLSDPEEAKGTSDIFYFSTEYARNARKQEEALMSGEVAIVDYEESDCWPDGSTFWVSTKKQILKSENGFLFGTFGISRDITVRKQQELLIMRTNSELQEAKMLLEAARSRLDLRLERAATIAQFGFFEYDLHAGNPRLIKTTSGLNDIFGVAENCGILSLGDLTERIHNDDATIWNAQIDYAETYRPTEPIEVRCVRENGEEAYLYVKIAVEEVPNSGRQAIIGFVQDITNRKRGEMRRTDLELGISGFQHMIPGRAHHAILCLEQATASGESEFAIAIAGAFLLMVRQKADEVRSLFHGAWRFRQLPMDTIFHAAWINACDLHTSSAGEIKVIYGHDTEGSMLVPGALFTVAINLFSNARNHGSAPVIAWTFMDKESLVTVFADGGPNERKRQRPTTNALEFDLEDHGVGLPLVKRVLALSGDSLENLPLELLALRYPHLPHEMKACKTFYLVIIKRPY